jgi:ERCC4-type nuclease
MITADDRENEKLLHRLFVKVGDRKTDPKGQCVVKRLKTGDYIIGDYGIEAKEINDLYRSILGIGRNGRTIKHQLAELCEAVEYPILAVYNTTLKPYFKGRKPKRQEVAREVLRQQRVIKSFKMTLYSQFPKIRLIEFNDMDDFVEWLAILNMNSAMRGKFNPVPRNQPPEDTRLRVLCAIQGITEPIAVALLEKYGSLNELLKAKVTQKDLMKVKGVGRVTARRIKELRKQWVY